MKITRAEISNATYQINKLKEAIKNTSFPAQKKTGLLRFLNCKRSAFC